MNETVATVRSGSVKSVFAHLDCLVEGIDALQKADINDFTVTAPLPRHEIEELIYKGKPSPVRWFTLCGAIFGGIFGFTLCSLTHLNWAMIIPAGKPLVSIPPFMVITFESTVLWGCLATLLGMVINCRLPGHNLAIELTDPRFSDDVFGLVVQNCTRTQATKATALLSESGALEVTNGYALVSDTPAATEVESKPPIAPVGCEPDEPNTEMLVKVTIGTTVILAASILFAFFYFNYSVSEELKAKGYSTPRDAVPALNRPNDAN